MTDKFGDILLFTEESASSNKCLPGMSFSLMTQLLNPSFPPLTRNRLQSGIERLAVYYGKEVCSLKPYLYLVCQVKFKQNNCISHCFPTQATLSGWWVSRNVEWEQHGVRDGGWVQTQRSEIPRGRSSGAGFTVWVRSGCLIICVILWDWDCMKWETRLQLLLQL